MYYSLLILAKYLFIIFLCVVAPEIPVPPVNTTVIDGEEAVFNCTVVGDPLPTISWYISGVDLSLSNMAPFDQEGRIDDFFITTTMLDTTSVMSSLTLNETVPYLAEDYVCVASNSLGSVNRIATLTVHGEYHTSDHSQPQACCGYVVHLIS